eukprot:SAG11_NODE_2386_length_3418_cov_1.215728_4_plen_125_part_00
MGGSGGSATKRRCSEGEITVAGNACCLQPHHRAKLLRRGEVASEAAALHDVVGAEEEEHGERTLAEGEKRFGSVLKRLVVALTLALHLFILALPNDMVFHLVLHRLDIRESAHRILEDEDGLAH